MVNKQIDLITYAAQLALESEALALGIEKYREAMQAGEDTLPPGQKLIKAAVLPLAEAIKALIKGSLDGRPGKNVGIVKFLAQFEPERTAFVAAKKAIHGITEKVPLQTLAMQVASALEDCINFDKLKEEEPRLYRQLLKKIERTNDEGRRHIVMRAQQKYAKVASIKWGLSEKVRLGTTLIHMMVEHTGLVELVRVSRGKNDTPTFVVATAKTLLWLEQAHARCELLDPVYLPMVIPPREWGGPFGGGYLSKELGYSLIKVSNKNYLEELKHWDMPEVYQAVNALQNTAWAVNAGVLDVARSVWDGGGRLGKLPARDPIPLPPQGYAVAAEPEEHKAWKRAAAKVYEENVRLTSKRMSVAAKLRIAEKLQPYGRFHFPHALDWRGRAYPVSSQLNPQGDDLAKALLQFAEGKPLGEHGASWLAVHGANCYGVDKVSLEDRIRWVLEHRDAILDSAVNPLDGARFWAEADSPYMFLAFCFEWAGYTMQGEEYVSYLPVSWDGSCNGLQHLSAMLRDEVGGRATNLTPSEKPSDIYSEVAREAQALIDQDAVGGNVVAQRWVGRMSRKLTKRNTMTVPYGVSRYGMRDQLRQEFAKARTEGSPLTGSAGTEWEDAQYLAEKNYQAIGQVVVAARLAMGWLQETAKVVAADGLPIRWTTPMGLLVQQDYRQVEGKAIDFTVSGRRYQMVLQVAGTRIDKRRQAAGISPNFVHSLDAAHMMRTVNYCLDAGMSSFAMIHDSYGAHAADAEELSYQLRRAFVRQYAGDVLEGFRQQLIEQVPEELALKIPPLPPMGTLDLEAVMDSGYFFA